MFYLIDETAIVRLCDAPAPQGVEFELHLGAATVTDGGETCCVLAHFERRRDIFKEDFHCAPASPGYAARRIDQEGNIHAGVAFHRR